MPHQLSDQTHSPQLVVRSGSFFRLDVLASARGHSSSSPKTSSARAKAKVRTVENSIQRGRETKAGRRIACIWRKPQSKRPMEPQKPACRLTQRDLRGAALGLEGYGRRGAESAWKQKAVSCCFCGFRFQRSGWRDAIRDYQRVQNDQRTTRDNDDGYRSDGKLSGLLVTLAWHGDGIGFTIKRASVLQLIRRVDC